MTAPNGSDKRRSWKNICQVSKTPGSPSPTFLRSSPCRAAHLAERTQPETKFVMSASEPLEKVSPEQRALLQSYLRPKTDALRGTDELLRKFPHTLRMHDPNR